jgi:hypothetical protein
MQRKSELGLKIHWYNRSATKKTVVRLCIKTCDNSLVVNQFNFGGTFRRYLQAAKIMCRESIPFCHYSARLLSAHGLLSFLECKTDADIFQRMAGAIVYGRPAQSGHRSGDKHCTVDREVAVCILHWEN